jgi:Glycerophosphoryl diester phosphodiesterase family
MNPNRRPGVCILALGLVVVFGRAAADDRPASPLRQAHAHNDYEHARPLFDALAQGFCSVEADIYLVDGQLLVAHNRPDVKPERTLEKLYLDPLRARAKANNGQIYPGGPPFWLLIDVKTEAKATYAALHPVLECYADILSVTTDGRSERKTVTVVISGNTARDAIKNQTRRFAAIDGRPPDLDTDAPAHLVPWVSESWTKLFKWTGEGPIPAAEKAKLREFVGKAHQQGRLVRFWATPEKAAVWEELHSAGVDLINTDKLAELRKFLLAARESK